MLINAMTADFKFCEVVNAQNSILVMWSTYL